MRTSLPAPSPPSAAFAAAAGVVRPSHTIGMGPGGDTTVVQHPSASPPHALIGVAHAPPGMPLPAGRPVEATRSDDPLRTWLDVLGGVAFALLIGLVSMRLGSALFRGSGWVPVIAWESVWLIATILCAPLMPTGIRHDISWRSTVEGLKLDWPELLYATMVLGMYVQWLGGVRLDVGPVALALAVGTAEEFIFRVLLLGWLITKLPAPTALVVSSLVFGMAHLQELSIVGLLSVMPQTAGGFVLGAVYLRTRNPIGPILAHAYWDYPYFMAIGGAVSGGSPEAGMPTIIMLLPWLSFALYGLWLVRDGVSMVGRVDPVGCSCDACLVHGR